MDLKNNILSYGSGKISQYHTLKMSLIENDNCIRIEIKDIKMPWKSKIKDFKQDCLEKIFDPWKTHSIKEKFCVLFEVLFPGSEVSKSDLNSSDSLKEDLKLSENISFPQDYSKMEVKIKYLCKTSTIVFNFEGSTNEYKGDLDKIFFCGENIIFSLENSINYKAKKLQEFNEKIKEKKEDIEKMEKYLCKSK